MVTGSLPSGTRAEELSMARHHLCRYCNRYDRSCGRDHTEETRADWGRTWDGHPAPKHPTPVTTSRGETMTEPRTAIVEALEGIVDALKAEGISVYYLPSDRLKGAGWVVIER